MALAASHRPLDGRRPPAHTRGVRRVATVTEFVMIVVLFGTVLGLAIGTGVADVLVLVLHHVDHALGAPRAR